MFGRAVPGGIAEEDGTRKCAESYLRSLSKALEVYRKLRTVVEAGAGCSIGLYDGV